MSRKKCRKEKRKNKGEQTKSNAEQNLPKARPAVQSAGCTEPEDQRDRNNYVNVGENARNKSVKNRLCFEHMEMLENYLAGSKVMTSSEYLARHNVAIMTLAFHSEKKYNLLKREHIMKNP